VWPLAVPESVVFDEVEKFLKKPDLPNARGKKVLSMIVSLLVPILLKPHLQCYGWINVTVTTIINNRGLPKWLTANLTRGPNFFQINFFMHKNKEFTKID
jgi:hypothetical protein